MQDADRAVESLAGGDGARPSDGLLAFTQGWEGCRLTPYQDGAGFWTVGFGHKMQPTDARVPVTMDEAVELLQGDLECAADSVRRLIYMPLPRQCMFDALTDFVFNLGATAFATSNLRKRVNGGYFADAADLFRPWNNVHVNGVLVPDAGLTKRRAAERAMFLDGDYSGRP